MSSFKKVLEFHRKFKLDIGDLNTDPSEKFHILRMKLIDEEVKETHDEVVYILEDDYRASKANLIKELIDVIYVAQGYLVGLGVDGDKAFDLVHQSNMSKLDDNGEPIFREDGKVLKSHNYKPVNVEDLLIPLEK
jgi:predicted HAD superfamily Cof-like phosphohydrolase